jgi:hypothetical protein
MNKSLIAKTVIKNQYWVVTDGEKKVGNVTAEESGYNLKLNGSNHFFKTTNDIKKYTLIEFESLKTKIKSDLPFYNFPTPTKFYNSILDIKRKLHLFTKTRKSKCYYAAGWFVINQTQENEVVFCPKYIFVQRYKYIGPFLTKTEAESLINTL